MVSRQINDRTRQAVDLLSEAVFPTAKHHFCGPTTANGPQAAGPAPSGCWLPQPCKTSPCAFTRAWAQTTLSSGVRALIPTPCAGCWGDGANPCSPGPHSTPRTAAQGRGLCYHGPRSSAGCEGEHWTGCGKGEP